MRGHQVTLVNFKKAKLCKSNSVFFSLDFLMVYKIALVMCKLFSLLLTYLSIYTEKKDSLNCTMTMLLKPKRLAFKIKGRKTVYTFCLGSPFTNGGYFAVKDVLCFEIIL